jgi:hypothetical protein
MGYRSDVRSVIYGETSKMKVFMDEHQAQIQLVQEDVTDIEVKENDGETVLHMHNDSVKWYEDYPGVIAWNKMLEKAEEAELAYEFIEIGEDPSDYTQRSAGPSRGMIGYVRQTVLNEEF